MAERAARKLAALLSEELSGGELERILPRGTPHRADIGMLKNSLESVGASRTPASLDTALLAALTRIVKKLGVPS